MEERKGVFRGGGTALIVAGLLVFATIPLIPVLIPSLNPPSAQAGLKSLETQGTLYALTWVLYLVSDLLFLVGFYALYSAFRHFSRAAVMVALIFTVIFVAIDVGVDIPLRLSLIGLSNSYSSASPGQQASIMASARQTMNDSNVVALAATFFQFLALILASYALPKRAEFRRSFAYLGFACGAIALLFIPAFLAQPMLAGLFNISGFVLLVIWSVGVGRVLRAVSSGN